MGMQREDDLVEPESVPEIFVDGFTGHFSKDGVMCCVGYRTLHQRKTVVIRLVWPAVNTIPAIEDAKVALAMPEPIDTSMDKRGVH